MSSAHEEGHEVICLRSGSGDLLLGEVVQGVVLAILTTKLKDQITATAYSFLHKAPSPPS
jgi:hypothetical protein